MIACSDGSTIYSQFVFHMQHMVQIYIKEKEEKNGLTPKGPIDQFWHFLMFFFNKVHKFLLRLNSDLQNLGSWTC